MNRRPTFYNWTYSQDSGGGPSQQISEQWEQWAEVKDTSGSTYTAQGTELIRSDYRVKVRYHPRFTATTWMIYEGQYCKLVDSSVQNEGKKRFLILQYSKTETFVDLS